MGVGYTNDLTQKYKQGLYNIQLEVSGWDEVNFQVVAPLAAPLGIYGSLNNGMSQGSLYTDGNYGADRALDWTPIRATNVATGTAATTISTAGIYTVPVNSPYIKLGAAGANVYGLFQFNTKV